MLYLYTNWGCFIILNPRKNYINYIFNLIFNIARLSKMSQVIVLARCQRQWSSMEDNMMTHVKRKIENMTFLRLSEIIKLLYAYKSKTESIYITLKLKNFTNRMSYKIEDHYDVCYIIALLKVMKQIVFHYMMVTRNVRTISSK